MLALLACLCGWARGLAQQQVAMLPEAPLPQVAVEQAAAAPQQQAAPPEPSAAQATDPHAIAEQQLKQEEKQRVLGVVPSFNVSYLPNAVSLTGWQKIELATRTVVDPATIAGTFFTAAYHEVNNDDPGFGWGPEGYGRRVGAAYLDAMDGTMIGNGILPALLHQDPRYFRLGHGSFHHRLFYAVATTVICKHDNTGKWEPNYSNVLGNIAAGAISNIYYPSAGAGVEQTISTGIIQTAEGGIASAFEEFWPDISRKLLHRDPTHGQDAQAQQADRDARK